MKRLGRVISRHGDQAVVQMDAPRACGRCTAGKGCGILLFSQPNQRVSLHCDNSVGADIEQTVTVHTPDPGANWLSLVLAAYGLPTVGMLAGALAGAWLMSPSIDTMTGKASGYTDAGAMIGAALGLAGGLIAWIRIGRSFDAVAQTGQCPIDTDRQARIVSVELSAVGETP